MFKFIVFLLITIITNYRVEGSVRRIIHGTKATRNEFPFIVAIEYINMPFCGGSLITLEHVLTAAHCMVMSGNGYEYVLDASDLEVVAGDVNLSKNNGSESRETRYVTMVAPHPYYDSFTVENDIGLLQVETEFVKSDQVKPIRMTYSTPKYKQICYVAGWGAISENTQKMQILLRKAKLEIKHTSECNSTRSYNGEVPLNALCAGSYRTDDIYEKNVEDACQGDSGGPLICCDVLAGIVSFGTGCGNVRYPGIYTDVSKFHDFIEKAMSGDLMNLRMSSAINDCKPNGMWTAIILAITHGVTMLL